MIQAGKLLELISFATGANVASMHVHRQGREPAIVA